MNIILKKMCFKLILHFSSNQVRVFVYKNLFKYDIGRNVNIGKSIINCKKVEIDDNVKIGESNFISCGEFKIGENSKILTNNTFTGKALFQMGKDSRVIYNHKFDVSNSIIIGNRTWIEGDYSQVWTHGSLKTKKGKDLSVQIGNDVYVGSSALIAPGVKVESYNLIGLGSVLLKSISTTNNVISGNPAEIIKTGVDWKENW
jgi:acetyltransferase-like isoleucine patch superfamily enzyme